jgi:hypothetical protein
MRTARSRLGRLEAAIKPQGKKFFLWDRGDLDPEFDLEAEKQRLRDEEGMSDSDQLIIVSWLRPDEGVGRVTETASTLTASTLAQVSAPRLFGLASS